MFVFFLRRGKSGSSVLSTGSTKSNSEQESSQLNIADGNATLTAKRSTIIKPLLPSTATTTKTDGSSVGTSVRGSTNETPGSTADEGDEEYEDEEEIDLTPSHLFEEPAPLKREILRVPCQLISLVRMVTGWLAITPTAMHFLQNHAEQVVSEVATPGAGKYLLLTLRPIACMQHWFTSSFLLRRPGKGE